MFTKICKDCKKKIGLFQKKIEYDNPIKKEHYFVCEKCWLNNRKEKEEKISQKLNEDFIKAKRYAQLNNCDIITAYKKLKLGDYADG